MEYAVILLCMSFLHFAKSYSSVYRGGEDEQDTYRNFGGCKTECSCPITKVFFMTDNSLKTCYTLKELKLFSNGCWNRILRLKQSAISTIDLERRCEANVKIDVWDFDGQSPTWNREWNKEFLQAISITENQLQIDTRKIRFEGLLLRINYACQYKFRGSNVWIPRCTLVEVKGHQVYPLQKNYIFNYDQITSTAATISTTAKLPTTILRTTTNRQTTSTRLKTTPYRRTTTISVHHQTDTMFPDVTTTQFPHTTKNKLTQKTLTYQKRTTKKSIFKTQTTSPKHTIEKRVSTASIATMLETAIDTQTSTKALTPSTAPASKTTKFTPSLASTPKPVSKTRRSTAGITTTLKPVLKTHKSTEGLTPSTAPYTKTRQSTESPTTTSKSVSQTRQFTESLTLTSKPTLKTRLSTLSITTTSKPPSKLTKFTPSLTSTSKPVSKTRQSTESPTTTSKSVSQTRQFTESLTLTSKPTLKTRLSTLSITTTSKRPSKLTKFTPSLTSTSKPVSKTRQSTESLTTTTKSVSQTRQSTESLTTTSKSVSQTKQSTESLTTTSKPTLKTRLSTESLTKTPKPTLKTRQSTSTLTKTTLNNDVYTTSIEVTALGVTPKTLLTTLPLTTDHVHTTHSMSVTPINTSFVPIKIFSTLKTQTKKMTVISEIVNRTKQSQYFIVTSKPFSVTQTTMIFSKNFNDTEFNTNDGSVESDDVFLILGVSSGIIFLFIIAALIYVFKKPWSRLLQIQDDTELQTILQHRGDDENVRVKTKIDNL